MSKDRLKEIIKRMDILKKAVRSTEFDLAAVEFVLDHGEYLVEQAERANKLAIQSEKPHRSMRFEQLINKRYRETVKNIKKTAEDYRDGHLLDIQDTFFVDEIIAIINNLEESE